MDSLLDRIQLPDDIRTLSQSELEELASELRLLISEVVAKNGGHLASNLGTVELTLALFQSFDFRRDRIVWDVGHQSYCYKILSGRRQDFASLRQKGGLSGFPKREESDFDAFNTGHSSTAVSAALGLSRALRVRACEGRVLAVVGDGAMTGGMFYEAVNNIDPDTDNVLIIINDNQMSIGQNVGLLSKHLNNLRVSKTYWQAKKSWGRALSKLPLLGLPLLALMNRVKYYFRRKLAHGTDNVYFETLGLRYYGPVDGHDLPALKRHIEALKRYTGPAVLHVCTQKGKGYEPAETSPQLYHGVAPFSLDRGVSEEPAGGAGHSFTQAFSEALLELSEERETVVALTAAMRQGTGLDAFQERFPARFYDVGIAEAHAVTLAAGLAAGGLRPVVCLYATFMQRALDQLLHDVALQALPVVFALDRAGIVGNDGETHQGIYDSAFLSAVPGLHLLYPSCYAALRRGLRWALSQNSAPVALRYPRGSEDAACAAAYAAAYAAGSSDRPGVESVELPRPLCLRKGRDICLAVLGRLCGEALAAAERLAEEGIEVEVIDLERLKPFPLEEVMESALRCGALISLEEQLAAGGAGEYLALALQERGCRLAFHSLCLPDRPLPQASPQESLADCGLTRAALIEEIRALLAKKEEIPVGPERSAC